MGVQQTANYKLSKPDKGTREWDVYLNQNADALDAELQRQKGEDSRIDTYYKGEVSRVDTRINNIVAASGSANTEVQDARLGADNVSRPTLGALVREIHGQQINSNRQAMTLNQRQNIVNTSQATPINVLNIRGRTLVNLGAQTVLDPAKTYLFYTNGRGGIKLAGESVFTYGYKAFTGQSSATFGLRDDFKGKVAGSTVEAPHITKYGNWSTIQPPSSFTSELPQFRYDNISILDGTAWPHDLNNKTSGSISQQLFSFDLVQIVERKYGIGFFAGCATLADKVARLKTKLTKIQPNWYGYGSGPAGNKVYFDWWRSGSNSYGGTPAYHTNGVPSKLYKTILNDGSGNLPMAIDSNGFVYCIAYADAGDGTTAGIVYTDFIELEVEHAVESYPYKAGSRLYEITAAEKTYIDGLTTAARDAYIADKYPFVQDVKQIYAPYIEKKGKNLIPPFTQWDTIYSEFAITGPYEATLNATADFREMNVWIPVIGGQTYSFVLESDRASSDFNVLTRQYQSDKTTFIQTPAAQGATFTFIAPSNCGWIQLAVRNNAGRLGYFQLKNMRMNLGFTDLGFELQNNDVIYFPDIVLAGNIDGSVRDLLTEREGRYFKSKRWVTDLILDGSLPWVTSVDQTGYKIVKVPSTAQQPFTTNMSSVKYNGIPLKTTSTFTNVLSDFVFVDSSFICVGISDVDSGWGEAYAAPTTAEIQAFFNGWTAKTVDTNGKPTAWKSIMDGTDAPTQTLAYVSANKAPNYTPYKVSYQLSTTTEEEITPEGSVSLHQGGNVVTLGEAVMVREKATPATVNGTTLINHLPTASTWLKNKASKILAVYRNGVLDKKWEIVTNTTDSYGTQRARITNVADYDVAAEYTVTYVIQEKEKFSASNLDAYGEYDTSLKNVVNDNQRDITDIKQATSANVRSIAELYKRIKAIGG